MVSKHWYINQKLNFVYLTLLVLMLPVHTGIAATATLNQTKEIHDLRIIVDISGSMKKTDPKNLRRPAIRLLAGLIPQGARSGIWFFGKQVNMSVKIGPVNDAWRELAREQSKKISSAGLYTNIESAMRKATFDWKKPDLRYKRNLILLTDGHVDLSEDDNKDTASRRRILKEVLPVLEKANVRIHTIALSDDVDDSLLSTLSSYTDGLYKKVSSADELQKLFLQMLEQSVKLNTLPLEENKFNVDTSVNDMTLLVFNKNAAEPTKLITPDKNIWNEKSNSNEVKWFRDEGFDLITIKKPQHGQWEIVAPEDKNNRVVVATNLKLKVKELPSYLMFGDVIKVTAELEEDGKSLTNKNLLSKFDFSMTRQVEGHDESSYEMPRPNKNNISEYQLPAVFKKGINELTIKAKSATVEREVHHQFKVYETPAEIIISEKEGKYEVKVIPYTNLLRLDSVKINVVLEDKSIHELIRDKEEWLLKVDGKHKETPFTLNVEAVRADGNPVSMSFNKMLSSASGAKKLKLSDENDLKEHSLKNKDTVKSTTDNKKDDKTEHEAKGAEDELSDEIAKEEKEEKEAEMSWTNIIGLVAVGNIILFGLLGGGFLYLRKRKDKMTKDVKDGVGDIDAGETNASK